MSGEQERYERIRILLRTRNDPYSGVRAKGTPYTTAGPAPGRKRKCPACDGTGKTRLRQKCQACDGLKVIAVDSYTGRVSDSDARKPQPMTPERREAELQRLSSSLTLSAGKTDPNEAYGWERAVEARNRQGSYRELERALEALRTVAPTAWDFILWIYGSGLDVELSPWSRACEERIIAALAAVMPRRIRLPRHLHAVFVEEQKKSVTTSEIADTLLA